MDDNENNIQPLDSEIKPKRMGFFKRLRRGFSSVFQRKSHKKRCKSDPCLPEEKNCAGQSTAANADRLSVGDTERESIDVSQETADAKNARDPNYRPPAKAPMIVNDFTMELKKSLKLRSKMVEEGQTSDAIMQIEMTRSNYSTTEEENIAEMERKTVEEKVALFESQICGGSLQNSLSRTDNMVEMSVDTVEEKEEVQEEKLWAALNEDPNDNNQDIQICNVVNENLESLVGNEINTRKDVEKSDSVGVVRMEGPEGMIKCGDSDVGPEKDVNNETTTCLEFSELVNETGEKYDCSEETIDKDNIANYEVTVAGEQNTTISDEISDDWEKVNEKLEEFEMSSDDDKLVTNNQDSNMKCTVETNGNVETVEDKLSHMMSGESLNNGILVTENVSAQIDHVENFNSI